MVGGECVEVELMERVSEKMRRQERYVWKWVGGAGRR